MLGQGVISAFFHGVLEYLAGALLIAAPFIFGFDADAAVAASIVAGLILLVVTAASKLPTGLTKTIPVVTHVVLDVALAGGLIAAPFVFSFSDEGAPTAFFLVVGVVHLLVTIGTRFIPGEESLVEEESLSE